MTEFEKWLEKLDYKKIEHQTSNIDDACEDTKNLILSKYQELTKDKIVLVLDKEEAEIMEKYLPNEAQQCENIWMEVCLYRIQKEEEKNE